MKENEIEVLKKYIPTESINYVVNIFNKIPIKLIIKRKRHTKSGDYKYSSIDKKHCITINYDLNKYNFLITLIHEIAHAITFEETKYKNVKPHGIEWQNNFKKIIFPLINANVFPENLKEKLIIHFLKPKASTYSDKVLLKELNTYSLKNDLYIEDIPINAIFMLENGNVYQKLEKNRTRFKCKSLNNDKIYLISSLAPIKLMN